MKYTVFRTDRTDILYPEDILRFKSSLANNSPYYYWYRIVIYTTDEWIFYIAGNMLELQEDYISPLFIHMSTYTNIIQRGTFNLEEIIRNNQDCKSFVNTMKPKIKKECSILLQHYLEAKKDECEI